MKFDKHPMQPLVWDGGVIRFKRNPFVCLMLELCGQQGKTLNELIPAGFAAGCTGDDYAQFVQLTGYSVSGFGELSAVPRALVHKADALAAKMVKEKGRGK